MICADNIAAKNLYVIAEHGIHDRLNHLPAAGVGGIFAAIAKMGRPELRKKNLVLRETNVALGLQRASGEWPELGVGKNPVGL
ncbi:hypothetical protein GQX74_005486 [Glossina fuscipes]|nr:hypothetical protein GQX74_005486 [Glossina fuscipes]